MIATMILLFVAGYLLIAMEHKVKINKAAIALIMCGGVWTVLSLWGDRADLSSELLSHLGDTCEILIFLIGAMTIVDLIDTHGGFNVITEHIATRDRHRLLWMLSIITFFLSAVLDNMTTTIIMVMMMRRIIADSRERWIFASLIVIAANSGGAWSPIGDVTTIMLWMRGNVTAGRLMLSLFLPCLVSVAVPVLIAGRYIGRSGAAAGAAAVDIASRPKGISPRESRMILLLGVAGLLFVPLFKELTGLPPYMGMIIVLGVMWTALEIFYDRKRGMEESIKNRVSKVLKHIDMPTILFFLGILMSVAALQSAGILGDAASWLDKEVHEVFTIAGAIGILSSVIDNVPLVAACMGMYPVADAAAVAAGADPAYLQQFMQDGLFWHLLTFCAGVGGSLLIIGSAAGVVAMGLENIRFTWYLKRISWLALAGYLAGIGVIWLENLLLGI